MAVQICSSFICTTQNMFLYIITVYQFINQVQTILILLYQLTLVLFNKPIFMC